MTEETSLPETDTEVNKFVANSDGFLPDLRQSPRKARPLPSVNKRITKKRKRILIEAIAHTGILTHSLRIANITSTSYYNHLESDPAFAEEVQRAIDFSTDCMEAEAIRRGVEGYKEAVYHQGKVVGWNTRYSDKMLEIMLKARKPDVFGNRTQMDITSKGEKLEMSESRTKLLGMLDLEVDDAELIEHEG